MRTLWRMLPDHARDFLNSLAYPPLSAPWLRSLEARRIILELQSTIIGTLSTPRRFEPWMGEHPRECVRWSEAEDQELLRFYNEGWPFQRLAERHGRRVSGITSRLDKLGIDRLEQQHASEESELEALHRRVSWLEKQALGKNQP